MRSYERRSTKIVIMPSTGTKYGSSVKLFAQSVSSQVKRVLTYLNADECDDDLL